MKTVLRILFLCLALGTLDVQAMERADDPVVTAHANNADNLIRSERMRFVGLSFDDQIKAAQCGLDTTGKKIQLLTTCARLPLAITANFLKTKNPKLGYMVSAVTNAVRLLDNSLSIANYGANKYNCCMIGYDLYRCGKDITTAFSKKTSQTVTASTQKLSIITAARKILLPLVETYYAFTAVCAPNITTDGERAYYQSLSSFAQLLSDYLDSESKSTESKFLLACLIVNGASSLYDLIQNISKENEFQENMRKQALAEQLRQQQEEEQRQQANQSQQRQEAELQRQRDEEALRQPIQQQANPEQSAVLPVLNAHVIGEGDDIRVVLQRVENLNINSNGRCPICITDYEAADAIAVFPCNHAYHADCFDQGMNVRPDQNVLIQVEEDIYRQEEVRQSNNALSAAQNTCGICRAPIAENTTQRIVIADNVPAHEDVNN